MDSSACPNIDLHVVLVTIIDQRDELLRLVIAVDHHASYSMPIAAVADGDVIERFRDSGSGS